MNFCGLHNHTEYSNVKLRDCIVKIKDLVSKAISYGYKGIAITDHEVLSGHVEAINMMDKIKESNPDFKLMLGNEIYLIDETPVEGKRKYFHFILIAKDKVGYEQMRALSSRAWERSYTESGITRTPTYYSDFEEIVGEDKGHLVASTACLGGQLATAILSNDSATINFFIPWMLQMFGADNCFLEMQDSNSEEQMLVNRTIVRISDYFKIPYIVTSDVHYLDAKDINIHSAFLNSKVEKDRETQSFYAYTYLKKIEEIRKILDYLPANVVETAINNTMKVYDLVESFDIRHSTIVPSRKPADFALQHLFRSWYWEYDAIARFANSEFEQDRFLLYLIEKGIVDKKIEITQQIAERINTELDVVWYISERLGQRLSAYLNLVKNIIDIIWKVSFVGVSRGSAGCFLINYLIDIVQMNPLDYDIPYWRFANKERVDMMDIDIDVNPEKVPQIIALLREYYGEDNVLNCMTFKTESTKSAILTAFRGLGLNNDEAQSVSSLVPVNRGKVQTLKQCVEGDPENNISPAPEVERALRKHEGLFETVQKIEGLISGRGIHASALYIFNNGFLTQNSLMRAPNGTKTTAFDAGSSDAMGALKFDLLSTELQTKFMKCFELLLSQKQIEWKGDLHNTYLAYLHPTKLEYKSPEMWEKAANGEIINIFQFEGVQGQICIRKTRPQSVAQMGAANAVMRLQSDGSVSPIDRYVAFKNDISLWYKEMNDAGVLPEEYPILEKYLLPKFGCSIEQEDFMLLVMDPQISNFSLKDSNGLRKAIAKKKLGMIQDYKNQFFEQGKKAGTRDELLKYVWDYCIQSLAGYSFSIPHDIAYSIEAVQQMNLATRFNYLYWASACMSVNSGSSYTDFDNYQDGDEEEDEETEDNKKTTNTNYGKVARAIGEVQSQGIRVLLPDINLAQSDFIPDLHQNAILYGLQAITNVNADLIAKIISNRPYCSLENFVEKNPDFTFVQMISLIKAGCFDTLEKKSRKYIMDKYLKSVALQKVSKKEKLTMANFQKMLDFHAVPEQFTMQTKAFYFKKWITKNCSTRDEVTKKKYFVLRDADEKKFFQKIVEPRLTAGKDYDNLLDGYRVLESAFNKFYEKFVEPLKKWMETEEATTALYEKELQNIIMEWQEKYCQGSISKWEMDALSYYYSGHELAKVDFSRYGIRDFFSLPFETPVTQELVNGHTIKKEIPVVRIVGTVLNADKAKHIVTLLTPTGVVDVKFYKESFVNYNKRISQLLENGKKQVIEQSWFSRGNKLLVTGYRRENMFVPRRDPKNGKSYTVQLIIESIDGKLLTKDKREKGV